MWTSHQIFFEMNIGWGIAIISDVVGGKWGGGGAQNVKGILFFTFI